MATRCPTRSYLWPKRTKSFGYFDFIFIYYDHIFFLEIICAEFYIWLCRKEKGSMKNYILQTKKRTNIYEKVEAEIFFFGTVESEFVQILKILSRIIFWKIVPSFTFGSAGRRREEVWNRNGQIFIKKSKQRFFSSRLSRASLFRFETSYFRSFFKENLGLLHSASPKRKIERGSEYIFMERLKILFKGKLAHVFFISKTRRKNRRIEELKHFDTSARSEKLQPSLHFHFSSTSVYVFRYNL